jgi:hypothetical protein
VVPTAGNERKGKMSEDTVAERIGAVTRSNNARVIRRPGMPKGNGGGRLCQGQRRMLAKIAKEEMEKKASEAIAKASEKREELMQKERRRAGVQRLFNRRDRLMKSEEAILENLRERGWISRWSLSPECPHEVEVRIDAAVDKIARKQEFIDRAKQLEVQILLARTTDEAQTLINEALSK